jgi:hypothetical protein
MGGGLILTKNNQEKIQIDTSLHKDINTSLLSKPQLQADQQDFLSRKF